MLLSNSFVAMVFLLETLEHPRPCQLEMEQVRMNRTKCKSTLRRKALGRAKASTENKMAEKQVEELTTTTPVTTATETQARTTRKAKAMASSWTLWKRISLPKQLQPFRVLHKNRARSVFFRAVKKLIEQKTGSWRGQSIPWFTQGDMLVRNICFLTVVHSFTHVRSSVRTTRTVA